MSCRNIKSVFCTNQVTCGSTCYKIQSHNSQRASKLKKNFIIIVSIVLRYDRISATTKKRKVDIQFAMPVDELLVLIFAYALNKHLNI